MNAEEERIVQLQKIMALIEKSSDIAINSILNKNYEDAIVWLQNLSAIAKRYKGNEK